jgi:hypothetical protein
MASKNRSAEKESFWRLALDEFRASGLSARAFCAREGLAEPSFYSWRRTLAERDSQGLVEEQVELVPVRIVETIDGAVDRAPPPLLEVTTASGLTLRFPADICPRQLTSVLTAIGGNATC